MNKQTEIDKVYAQEMGLKPPKRNMNNLVNQQRDRIAELERKVVKLTRIKHRLIAVVENLILFNKPTATNAAAMNQAHQIIVELEGDQ